MQEERNSNIHLRPRFKMEFDENEEQLIAKFKYNLKDEECKYCSKIVDGHIVIDIPAEENHFWSPQLNIEVEKIDDKKSVVKGLFGPKPQVWTLFMFIHFGVGVAFIGFLIMWYVKYMIKEDVTFAVCMVIALPVFWFILYFIGRVGRKTGHKQMDELHKFMMNTLDKKP
ncbi:GTP-binding protein [Lutibacter sp. TH_r2]|uniref:GTP-binding protein n=1 Tax=Lutibacter sp. TH_r2 TaxID=3082083 RepID=UPI0029533517|nr:GTP-binding protein [Lutibacter sp. TH_r2]MDV7186113.1 GTP-binding protein [Lutibacter sp. TH_r2]